MKSKFITANNIRFQIKESGSGKLILLLHGFPEFSYSWAKVMPLLSHRFHVVAPDMRGYGQTDKPTRVSDYQIKILAQDVAELIRALGYEKAYIVGHDWGGGVAWEFAKWYPEMTEKLIVLNCPPAVVLQKHLLTSWKQFKMSWYIFFFQLPFLPEWWMHRNLKTFFWRGMRGWAIHKEAFQKHDIEQYENAFSKRSDFTGPVNYYRAAGRAMFNKSFRNIPDYEMDVMVIWGEADRALSKELTVGLEQYVKGKYQIHYISDSGHWVQHEKPELVAQYILDFCKE